MGIYIIGGVVFKEEEAKQKSTIVTLKISKFVSFVLLGLRIELRLKLFSW